MKPVVQKVTVGGILVHEGNVLVVQRASDNDVFPNLWEVPSGKKEKFERVADTAKREYKEETGVDIKVIKPIGVYNYKVEKEDETRDVTQINFLVEAEGEMEVKLSGEHQAYDWISKDELDKYNISPETKESILTALEVSTLL